MTIAAAVDVLLDVIDLHLLVDTTTVGRRSS